MIVDLKSSWRASGQYKYASEADTDDAWKVLSVEGIQQWDFGASFPRKTFELPLIGRN
jgi:hypothetical protein